jgi:hypothetical protein
VDDVIERLREREPTSSAFDKEFLLELEDGFLELFYSSQEQDVAGTDFCRQFVFNRNFFYYETTGENFGPEKVACRVREAMAVHLPDEHKMFKVGGDVVNVWKLDDEPSVPVPWFASACSLAPI